MKNPENLPELFGISALMELVDTLIESRRGDSNYPDGMTSHDIPGWDGPEPDPNEDPDPEDRDEESE